MLTEKNKNIILKGLGIFLLLFGLFIIIQAFLSGRSHRFFWICFIGMILIGIGILRKNSLLVVSQLNILTIPLLVWNIDFFYLLITKQDLWKITTYFFSDLSTLSRFMSLEHLFLLPLAFLALYLMKNNSKGAWKISIIQITFIYLAVKFLTERLDNINCFFIPCGTIRFTPASFPYLIEGFLLYLLMILITNYLLGKIKLFRKN